MEETSKPATPPPEVIKQWILPTGNDFIRDPSRRFVRPPGNPGEDVSYVQPDFDDSSWQQVNLPHDWAITGPFTGAGGGGMGRLPTAGVGWYRKRLTIPAADAGKSIFLEVDGAMSYATVWLNRQLVGGWPFGYASWRLDNPPNSSRWYPGAGIYRNLWLIKTSPVHVGHWGTFLTTPEVSSRVATVHLKVTVDNDSEQSATAGVATEFFGLDAKGRRTRAAVARIAPVELEIPPGSSAVAAGRAIILKPKLRGPRRNNAPIAMSP